MEELEELVDLVHLKALVDLVHLEDCEPVGWNSQVYWFGGKVLVGVGRIGSAVVGSL